MWLGSVLAMLPYTTTGFTYAYCNLGLPQMLEPNGSGILIDIHELSWIGKQQFSNFLTFNFKQLLNVLVFKLYFQ